MSTFLPMSPFHRASSAIIGCLNSALEGNGSITIRASKKGLSIHLGRSLLAKGKTPEELHQNFAAAMDKARQANASKS